MNDNVDHPFHYNHGTTECIDAIESALTPSEFAGFLKGNVLKYIWREREKGGFEDIQKARWYLDRLDSLYGMICSSGDVPQDASSGSAADTD